MIESAAITAGLRFTCGFLENAGYPRLSMFTTWPLMAISWELANGQRASLAR